MDKIEMIEKLCEKANVTMEEARDALECSDWDLLDAMILLEKSGKTLNHAARASSGQGRADETDPADRKGTETEKESVRVRLSRFFKGLFTKGMENHFVVRRAGKTVFDIPVLVAVILGIVMFWLVAILLVVGAVMGCEYSFRGNDLGKESINDGMKKASGVVQDLADQVRDAVQGHKE